MMGNCWIDSAEQLPPDGEEVLAVKQLKSGRRAICLARCIRAYETYDYRTKTTSIGPYWTCGGTNNIIFWMPLPKMPEGD